MMKLVFGFSCTPFKKRTYGKFKVRTKNSLDIEVGPEKEMRL